MLKITWLSSFLITLKPEPFSILLIDKNLHFVNKFANIRFGTKKNLFSQKKVYVHLLYLLRKYSAHARYRYYRA